MAELSVSGTSSQEKSSVHDVDTDFEPSADMLVHDFDDERTLEEEEQLERETNFSDEIDDLTREGDMPLHELLKMYGYGGADCAEDDDEGTEEQDVSENDQKNLDERRVEDKDKEDRLRDEDACPSSDESACGSKAHGTAQLIDYFDGNNADESEDEDYIPCEDWKKEVNVGPMYQVETPDGLCEYKDNEKAYENEDELLWNPESLPEKEVVEFLAEASKRSRDEPGVNTVPERPCTKDNEQALFELVQCNFDKEEALKRLKFSVMPAKVELPVWAEEERLELEQREESLENDNSVQQPKQFKLWRTRPSLQSGSAETTERALGGKQSQTAISPAEPSSRGSTHFGAHDLSTEQHPSCISDNKDDISHTNGSHNLVPTTAHTHSEPNTSKPSTEAVKRSSEQREDEEGSERALKRRKS